VKNGTKNQKSLLDEFTTIELAEIAAGYDIREKTRKRLIESLDEVMSDSEIRERLQVQDERDRSILLIEGISKAESYNETAIIAELAKMADFKAKRKQPNRKDEAIDLIRSQKYGLIHISSHGTKDSLQMGRATIRPVDLDPVDRIYSQILTISACEVGNKEFIRDIAYLLGIPIIIAPSRTIEFLDSAVFFVVFYYLFFDSIIKKRGDVYIYNSDILKRAESAFKKAKETIGKSIRGGIKFFDFTKELLNVFVY